MPVWGVRALASALGLLGPAAAVASKQLYLATLFAAATEPDQRRGLLMRIGLALFCFALSMTFAACSDGVTPVCSDDAGCGAAPTNDAGASAFGSHP